MPVLLVILIAICTSFSAAYAQQSETLLDAQGRPLDDPRYDKIRTLDEAQELGISQYRAGKFELAYKTLSEPARHGYKRAQHSLALMHLSGEFVDKNILIGTALMGLAAEGGDKRLDKEYQKLLKAIPEKYRTLVAEQTDYYIARYGAQAQGVVCDRIRLPGSNRTSFQCSKQLGTYEEYAWVP
jgi:hypothetical protein